VGFCPQQTSLAVGAVRMLMSMNLFGGAPQQAAMARPY
jgi:hypothetical protein